MNPVTAVVRLNIMHFIKLDIIYSAMYLLNNVSLIGTIQPHNSVSTTGCTAKKQQLSKPHQCLHIIDYF